MTFDIVISELGSRAIRQQITGEADGLRTIDDFLTITDDSTDEEGNFFYGLIKAASRFLGSGIGKLFEKAADFLSWSASEIWGLFVSGLQTVWNFNWTQSDEALDAQVQQGWQSLVSVSGSVLGNSAGWLLCGILPSTYIMSINKTLGLYLLKEVGEEAFDEFCANLGQLTHLLFQQTARSLFTWKFKKIRKFLFPDRDFSEAKPWSFALQYEKTIESIEDETIRTFIENFLEELWESCVEAGYVLTNALSNFYMEQKMSPSPLGADVAYEVKFDRNTPDIPDEQGIRTKHLFYGKSEVVLPQILSSIEENNQKKELRSFRETLPANRIQRDKAKILIKFSCYKAEDIAEFGDRDSEISFRTKETIENLTPSIIRQYAERARQEFARTADPGKLFIWHKGKKGIRYADPDNGMACRTYFCTNRTEGRRIVSALTNAAIGVNPDWALAKFEQNESETEAYDDTPPDEQIAGRFVSGVRRRPVVDVRVRYCQIIFGTRERHTLWDSTGKQPMGIYTIDL